MSGIGVRIKEIRKECGLTQGEFGKKLKVSKSHISNIELGGDNPSGTVIRLMCVEYGINEEWLLAGQGEKYNRTNEDILVVKDGKSPIYNQRPDRTDKADEIDKTSKSDYPELADMVNYLSYIYKKAIEREKIKIEMKFESIFPDYKNTIAKLSDEHK